MLKSKIIAENKIMFLIDLKCYLGRISNKTPSSILKEKVRTEAVAMKMVIKDDKDITELC
jgi:hypothetical protein